jgi:serine/threonine protein kinase
LDEKKNNVGEGPLRPLLFTMTIMLQITNGMNYLHENRVMHHDLEVNNVFINVVEDPNEHHSLVQVKFTNFGESKLKLHDSRYTTSMVSTSGARNLKYFTRRKIGRNTQN